MPRAALAFSLLLLVPALAGCVIEGPPPVQEGRHGEAPIQGQGVRPISAKGFEGFWRDPQTGETRSIHWDVTNGTWVDGVYTVESEALTLRYRLDEPLPVRLRYDEDLSRQNTFNFSYNEPRALGNRTVTQVVEVDPSSHLDVQVDEVVSRDAAGRFVLSFGGSCAAEDAGCEAPGEIEIVHIEAQYPPRRH